MSSSEPKAKPSEAASYLLTLKSIRQRTTALLEYPQYLQHFELQLGALESVANSVLMLIVRDYAHPAMIPPHSRWRHFEASNTARRAERIAPLLARWRSELGLPALPAESADQAEPAHGRYASYASGKGHRSHASYASFSSGRGGNETEQWVPQSEAEIAATKEIVRRLLDLFVVSVLLDAGAGPKWRFRPRSELGQLSEEDENNEPKGEGSAGAEGEYARSEGLALASLEWFLSGGFSSDPTRCPHRADAVGLHAVTPQALRDAFQVVDPINPLVGVDGRCLLLQRLGDVCVAHPEFFGSKDGSNNPPRPGNLLDYLWDHPSTSHLTDYDTGIPEHLVSIETLWEVIIQGFSGVWPPTRTVLDGTFLGDVWPCKAMAGIVASELYPKEKCLGGAADAQGLVPFHKLSQWLTYSLMEPLALLGIRFVGVEDLTGLAEYRNGGLFVDMGVIKLRSESYKLGLRSSTSSVPRFDVHHDVVVEWRALTVALLDRVAIIHVIDPRVVSDNVVWWLMWWLFTTAPGTWKAGREIAAQLRPSTKGPPIEINSDGTATNLSALMPSSSDSSAELRVQTAGRTVTAATQTSPTYAGSHRAATKESFVLDNKVSKHSGGDHHDHTAPLQPVVPPNWSSITQILLHALKGGARSFALAFALRGGITFVIKLFKVIRKRATLHDAIQSFFHIESHRFARMIGAFSFIWKLVNNSLLFYRGGGRQSKANGAIAGALAGLSILFEIEENRIGIAQQLFMRSMQAGYNALHTRKMLRIPHGDTLMMAVACGSIMYAYVVHPSTLPKSFYSFMVRTARVPGPILEFNRENIRKWEAAKITWPASDGRGGVDLENSAALEALKVDKSRIAQLLKTFKAGRGVAESVDQYVDSHRGVIPMVPCAMVHPSNIDCFKYGAGLWATVFWSILPVYGSLNGVPVLIFKTRSFLKNPMQHLQRGFKSSVISSSFLATYVSVFQSCVCISRFMYPDSPDRKVQYYLYGLLAGLAVLLEHEPRRAELAMYCLPKGLESLYTVLVNRGRMVRLPGIDVVGCCTAMSIIMSVYQVEPHQMSSMLCKVMRAMIGPF
eukprot:jgi/Hompol1/2761/HPOL_003023-RA